jgi:ribosomal protein S18 acetylase RimI-like enzyme
MWRLAATADDDDIVSMCLSLNAKDPGPYSVQPAQVKRTLSKLREDPTRGRALVCEVAGHPVGYAFLISFWSNELGGEVCTVDELFVLPDYRGRGLGTVLLEKLAEAEQSLWPVPPAALTLEVTARNHRARALYERLGFEGENLAMRRRLMPQRQHRD